MPQAIVDALAALITRVTTETGANPPSTEPVTKEFVYGSYVDEVVAYRQTIGDVVGLYYPHYNHLYSVAALTDHSGSVVERYSYSAFGAQTITAPTGAVRAKSAVGFDRGYTGYICDHETGLLHARNRKYSPSLGRFISRDPLKYVNGVSLYRAYFAPNALDPLGLETIRREFSVKEKFLRRVTDEIFWDRFTVDRKSVSGMFYNWNAYDCTCDEWKETHFVALEADRNGKRSYDLYVGGTVTVEIETGTTTGGYIIGGAGLTIDVLGALDVLGPAEVVTDWLAVGLDIAGLLGDWTEVKSAKIVDQNLNEIRKNETYDGVSLTNFGVDDFDNGSGGAVTGVKLKISQAACAEKDKAGRARFASDKAGVVGEMQAKINAMNTPPAGN